MPDGMGGATSSHTSARSASGGTSRRANAEQLSLLEDDYLSDEDIQELLESVKAHMAGFGDDCLRAARLGLYTRPMVDVETGTYL